MALSSNRQTMDVDREFAHLRDKIFSDNLQDPKP